MEASVGKPSTPSTDHSPVQTPGPGLGPYAIPSLINIHGAEEGLARFHTYRPGIKTPLTLVVTAGLCFTTCGFTWKRTRW